MQRYSLPLNVGDTKGRRIVARVTTISSSISQIDIPAPEAVIKDKPTFLVKNKIRMQYKTVDHIKVVNKLVSYLEGLFLKELENEDNNTSKSVGLDSRGSEKSSKSKSVGELKGKDSDTVRNSGRGDKQAESDRGRVKDTSVDKKSGGISKERTESKDKTISES